MSEDKEKISFETLYEEHDYEGALAKIEEEIKECKEECPSLEHNKMVCQYMLSSDNNVTQFISNLDKYIEKFNEYSSKDDVYAFIAKLIVMYNKALGYYYNYQFKDCISLLQEIISSTTVSGKGNNNHNTNHKNNRNSNNAAMNTANKPEIASLIVKCYLFWVDSVFQIFVSHNKPKEWLVSTCNPLFTSIDHFLTKLPENVLSETQVALTQVFIHLYKTVFHCYIDHTKGVKKENKLATDAINALCASSSSLSVNLSLFTTYTLFLRSRMEYNRGNMSKALKSLDAYMNESAGNQTYHYVYYNCNGNIQYMLGNFSLAIHYYKQSIKCCPESFHKLYIQKNLALTYYMHEDYAYSVQQFQDYLAHVPYNPYIWMRLGEAYYKLFASSNPTETLLSGIYQSHIYIQPTVSNSLGQGPTRVSYLQESSKTSPPDLRSYLLLAIQSLNNAIWMFKLSPSSNSMVSNPYVRDEKQFLSPLLHCLILKAYIHLQLRNPSETISTLQTIYASDFTLPQPLQVLLAIYYVQALLLLGKVDEAFDRLSPTKNKDLYVGTYLSKTGKEKKDEKNKNSAAATKKEEGEGFNLKKLRLVLLYHLAVTYTLKQNYSSALDVLNNILTIDPKCVQAIKLYYIVYMKTKGALFANNYMINCINPFS